MCVYVSTCVCVCVCDVCVCGVCGGECVCPFFVNVCQCVYVSVCVCVCVYMCECMCVCLYVLYIYIYMCVWCPCTSMSQGEDSTGILGCCLCRKHKFADTANNFDQSYNQNQKRETKTQQDKILQTVYFTQQTIICSALCIEEQVQ